MNRPARIPKTQGVVLPAAINRPRLDRAGQSHAINPDYREYARESRAARLARFTR